MPPGLQVKMATLQLFGSDDQCAAAVAMIEEAISNKDQKQKQRQKEYDKKKEVGLGRWWAAWLSLGLFQGCSCCQRLLRCGRPPGIPPSIHLPSLLPAVTHCGPATCHH
jgi:hypothetical protein